MQWNDRFRDDMRGFLRGEPGLVPFRDAAGCRAAPTCSTIRCGRSTSSTAHDGYTMYDLVAYERKHNEANGWDNNDGSGDNRSWNCGWEGDDGVPDEVMARAAPPAPQRHVPADAQPRGADVRRRRRVRPDPARQQQPVQPGQRDVVDRLAATGASSPSTNASSSGSLAFRREHHVLSDRDDWWGDRVEWFGVDGAPDTVVRVAFDRVPRARVCT